MAFLNNIEQLRSVNWGRKHDWDLKFPDAPAPFKDWFPAIDVEEPLAIHNPETIQVSNTQFLIPGSSGEKSLKITFYDDENLSLAKWISDWMNSITAVGGVQGVVSSVNNATKIVQVAKKNSRGVILSTTSYYVFPTGDVTFVGSSDSGIQMYSVSFAVVSKK